MRYLPTGNDYLALPLVDTERGRVENLTLTFMRLRGLVELAGPTDGPGLLQPLLAVDAEPVAPSRLEWQRLEHWLPAFRARQGSVEVTGLLCAPIDERGLLWQLRARNLGDQSREVTLGIQGCWAETRHRINFSKPLRGVLEVQRNAWFRQLVLEYRTDATLFALSLGSDQPLDRLHAERGAALATPEGHLPVAFEAARTLSIPPGEEAGLTICIGLGLDEMAACAVVEQLRRRGPGTVLQATCAWLRQRARSVRLSGSASAGLDQALNHNLFFNYFFAQGLTLDTEERVLLTSRSPRYYVSAAYWDRDSLLWSLPALLLVEPAVAREALLYAFRVQRRNFGIHSRYIDGVTLEPGLELDEVCAPVLALGHYLAQTEEWDLLDHPDIQAGLAQVEYRLQAQRHPEHALYATFLCPSDDFDPLPYLTYDNVLVWRALLHLAAWAERRGDLAGAEARRAEARRVEAAIWTHCVTAAADHGSTNSPAAVSVSPCAPCMHGAYSPPAPGAMFAWSTDLAGHWRRYDEPAGSLRLLPYLGFCSADEPTYCRTLGWLRSPENPFAFTGKAIDELGCSHNPHPWMLSLANGLLSGEADRATRLLLKCQTDNGVAAEAVHEDTGQTAGGEDFATCAGFLAYAIDYAFGRTA